MKKNLQQTHCTKKAFTLLELAVVLVVISVILSTAISVASTRIEAQRLTDTYARIELISSAIKQYIQNFERLPCPADGSIAAPTPAAPAPANYGIEARLTTGNEQCDNSPGVLDISGNVYSGVIPHESLGLSPLAGIDGWENRFTYVVDNRFTFTGSESLTTGYLGDIGPPDITIQNGNSTDITTTGIYLIFSHGQNGVGAWPQRGGTRNATPGSFNTDKPLEYENQESAGNFDTTFIQVSHVNNFDDILFYKNKWQINEE